MAGQKKEFEATFKNIYVLGVAAQAITKLNLYTKDGLLFQAAKIEILKAAEEVTGYEFTNEYELVGLNENLQAKL